MKFYILTKNRIFGDLLGEKIKQQNADDYIVEVSIIPSLASLPHEETMEECIVLYNDTDDRIVLLDYLKRRPEQIVFFICVSSSISTLNALKKINGLVEGIISVNKSYTEFEAIMNRIFEGDTHFDLQSTIQIPGLTPREHEVYNFVVNGGTFIEVASVLGMRRREYYNYRSVILKKMNVKSFKTLISSIKKIQ